MTRLSTSVRIAASSILLLSLVHIFFWAMLALALRTALPADPFNSLAALAWAFSAAGIFGVVVSVGIFRARNWARIAAIALAAIVAFLCAVGIAAPLFLAYAFAHGSAFSTGLGVGIELPSRLELLALVGVYAFVLVLAVWWIVLFSRKSITAQFSSNSRADVPAIPGNPSCPPPIALLAWLMIASGALSALSWPLILGKTPAMLFTHIFSIQTSQWIWGVNTLLFLACGAGLLRLHRWSYGGTIVLHAFWLASIFVSQLSPQYPHYLAILLNTFNAPESFLSLGFAHTPHALEAALTAIPTALLIAGLFYYRPDFQKAAAEAGR
jgi:hypothetical protein